MDNRQELRNTISAKQRAHSSEHTGELGDAWGVVQVRCDAALLMLRLLNTNLAAHTLTACVHLLQVTSSRRELGA